MSVTGGETPGREKTPRFPERSDAAEKARRDGQRPGKTDPGSTRGAEAAREADPPGKTRPPRPDRFLRMLGLCRRAGRCIIGSAQVFASMRKDPPLLVIAAGTASPASAKKIRTMCAYYQVPLLVSPYTGEALAAAVGKDSAVAAVGIRDARFAEELIKSSGKEVSVLAGTGR